MIRMKKVDNIILVIYRQKNDFLKKILYYLYSNL